MPGCKGRGGRLGVVAAVLILLIFYLCLGVHVSNKQHQGSRSASRGGPSPSLLPTSTSASVAQNVNAKEQEVARAQPTPSARDAARTVMMQQHPQHGSQVHHPLLIKAAKARRGATDAAAGSQRVSMPVPSVCLLGNAESTDAALRVHRMWSSAFTSCWYIWNEATDPHGTELPANMLVAGRAAKADALPFADGIHRCVQWLRRADEPSCDYFFTHDDDLTFRLHPKWRSKLATSSITVPCTQPTSGGPSDGVATAGSSNAHNDGGERDTRPHSHEGARLPDVLRCVLQAYYPALASFPWDVGLNRFSSIKAVADVYAGQAVGPLTGFDNGMVLYHRSIVDFFIPFAPRGEGGFTGKWTLGAHFLQLFAAGVFGEHALCISAMQYNNTINLDSVKETPQRNIRRVEGNLVYHQGVRHPYEYRLNDVYLAFLRRGLKQPTARFGRDLTPSDVAHPARGHPHLYTQRWVLSRVNSFYDLRGQALANNAYINAMPAAQLHATVAATPIHLIVHMFVYERLDSFERLWGDLNAAVVPAATNGQPAVAISIIIHYDNRDLRHLDHLLSLRSRVGPVHVWPRMQRAGLRTNVLESGAPAHADAFYLMLEDDMRLSPWALVYAVAAVRTYYYAPASPPRALLGVSLYAQVFSEAAEAFLDMGPSSGAEHERHSSKHSDALSMFLWQQPQSWGAVYHGLMWTNFIKWYRSSSSSSSASSPSVVKEPEFAVPCSYTSRWPSRTSWKKALFRYMVEENLYMAYPRMPRRLSFSVNALGVGVNDRASRQSSSRKKLEDRLLLTAVTHDDLPAIANLTSNSDSAEQGVGGHVNRLTRALTQRMAPLPELPVVGPTAARPNAWGEQLLLRDDLPHASEELNRLGRMAAGTMPSPPSSHTSAPSPKPVAQRLCAHSRVDAFDGCTVLFHAHALANAQQSADTIRRWMGWDRTGRVLVIGPAAVLPAVKAQVEAAAPVRAAQQQQRLGRRLAEMTRGEGQDSATSTATRKRAVQFFPYGGPPVAVTDAWFLLPTQPALLKALKDARHDCVVLHDEDAAFTLTDADYARSTWQGHFFGHLVGFSYLARSHEQHSAGQLTVVRRNTHAVSLLLPGALVVHRQYLLQLLAQHSAWIHEQPMCAGMLLNALVASQQEEDGRCPVVIWRWLSNKEKAELRSRPYEGDNFLNTQSECLTKAVRLLRSQSSHDTPASAAIPLYAMKAFDPRKRYGSSTPFAGLSFLKCAASPEKG